MELLIDVMYLLCLVSSISLVALKGVSEIYKILQVALLSKPSPNPNPIPNPNPKPNPYPYPDPNPNPNPNPNQVGARARTRSGKSIVLEIATTMSAELPGQGQG